MFAVWFKLPATDKNTGWQSTCLRNTQESAALVAGFRCRLESKSRFAVVLKSKCLCCCSDHDPLTLSERVEAKLQPLHFSFPLNATKGLNVKFWASRVASSLSQHGWHHVSHNKIRVKFFWIEFLCRVHTEQIKTQSSHPTSADTEFCSL